MTHPIPGVDFAIASGELLAEMARSWACCKLSNDLAGLRGSPMNKDLSAHIAAIRNSTSRLNILSDELNDSCREVERILSEELKIGITGKVNAGTGLNEDTGAESNFILEYCRFSSKFRLVVRMESYDINVDPTLKPWSDCSRIIKVKTAEALPELLKAVSLKAQSTEQEIGNAVTTVNNVIKTLTGKEV